jgi:uncharacterized membrane protein
MHRTATTITTAITATIAATIAASVAAAAAVAGIVAATVTTHLRDRLRRLREQPDAGMETVDKIMWAAVTVVVVSAVGLLFKTKVVDFMNGITISLGF